MKHILVKDSGITDTADKYSDRTPMTNLSGRSAVNRLLGCGDN